MFQRQGDHKERGAGLALRANQTKPAACQRHTQGGTRALWSIAPAVRHIPRRAAGPCHQHCQQHAPPACRAAQSVAQARKPTRSPPKSRPRRLHPRTDGTIRERPSLAVPRCRQRRWTCTRPHTQRWMVRREALAPVLAVAMVPRGQGAKWEPPRWQTRAATRATGASLLWGTWPPQTAAGLLCKEDNQPGGGGGGPTESNMRNIVTTSHRVMLVQRRVAVNHHGKAIAETS